MNLRNKIMNAIADECSGDVSEGDRITTAVMKVFETLDVLQPWVRELSMMQQTVLLAAIRGPDGIYKDHMVKVLLRWFRRCVLYSAMDHRILSDPFMLGGGSFTGPFRPTFKKKTGTMETFDQQREEYLRHVDELPHHFQLHLMHAAQIVGYKHPDRKIAKWWLDFYHMIVNDAHLFPEHEAAMDKRLGDNEADWRAREVVTAL